MKQNQASNSEMDLQPTASRRRRTRRPGLLLTLCTLAYALVLLGVSAANAIGPERWWLGSVNLYLPQWLWALPCAVILPWYLLRAWRWTWIPLAMLGWVFGPIMGLSFGLARLAPRPEGLRIRIITYNVKWGSRDPAKLIANIHSANPDLVIMQDAENSVQDYQAPLNFPGWYYARGKQYVVLSRYPLTDIARIPMVPQGRHYFLCCTIHAGSSRITLFDAHLMTPRFALNSLKEVGADGAGDVEHNAEVRMREADGLAEYVRAAKGPRIVAGDLNAPVQARACRTLLDCGLSDAYSEAGWGYGYTYGQSTFLHRPFVRIDHILVSQEWSVVDCREGKPEGSDHSPVIADLVLPNPSQGAQ